MVGVCISLNTSEDFEVDKAGVLSPRKKKSRMFLSWLLTLAVPSPRKTGKKMKK